MAIPFGIAPQILDRQQPKDAKPDAGQQLRPLPAGLGGVYDGQIEVVADSRDAECEGSEEVEPPEPGAVVVASSDQRNPE